MPVVDPATPPDQWELDSAARSAAAALRVHLTDVRRFATSPEQKAVDTITAIAPDSAIIIHPGLAEVRRPLDFVPGYRERAAAYLAGDSMPGWEPSDAVIQRFTAAINDITTDEPIAIASHGLAMTLWIDSVIGLTDRISWWTQLDFPHLVTVHPDHIEEPHNAR